MCARDAGTFDSGPFNATRIASSVKAVQIQVAEHATWMAEVAWNHARVHCKSPIEVNFYVAWAMLLFGYQVVGSPEGGNANASTPPYGPASADLNGPSFEDPVRQFDVIFSQFPVGNYRADFALRRIVKPNGQRGPTIYSPKVIVECDGHDFHEKSKDQARRDKERDRAMQLEGFYVLRFTGSELWKDPAACAATVNDFLWEHLHELVAASLKKTPLSSSV